jgi:hypothetical protein
MKELNYKIDEQPDGSLHLSCNGELLAAFFETKKVPYNRLEALVYSVYAQQIAWAAMKVAGTFRARAVTAEQKAAIGAVDGVRRATQALMVSAVEQLNAQRKTPAPKGWLERLGGFFSSEA